MAYPWASGAWATNSLASGSWEVGESNAGISWTTNSWAIGTFVNGSWIEAWAEVGEYSLAGQVVNFSRTYILEAATASFTLEGQSISPVMSASAGSIALVGQVVTFTTNQYRITLVNTNNEVVDNSTGIQINGTNLTGTNVVQLQYAKGNALENGSWTPTAWATAAWDDGSSNIVSANLTNVSVVNSTLITADMIDIETSVIPFTDANHVSHRIFISDGTRSSFSYIQVLPDAFNTVGTVQPADAITTAGQSILSGITITPNMQILLPVVIDGKNTTWETSNGNITGRLSLSAPISTPTAVSIPLWDETIGWDVINVTIKDISSINTTMSAEVGGFALDGQVVNWARNRVANVISGVFDLAGQVVGFIQSAFIQPSDMVLSPTISQPFLATSTTITSVLSIGPDVIQSGSNFDINGVGFGSDSGIDVLLIDFLGTVIQCSVVQINNSYIQALAPTNSGALSAPVKLYVGNYQRDGSNNIILSSGVPISTGINSSRDVSVVVFNIASMRSTTTIDNVGLIQQSLLDVQSLNSASILESSTLSGFTSSLVVNGLTSATTLGDVSNTQHNVLESSDLTVTTTIDNTALTQHYGLFVGSLNCATTLSSSTLHDNSLPTDGMRCQTTLSSPSLTEHNLLSVNGMNQATLLSNVSLIQHSLLASGNLTSTTTFENSTLVFKPYIQTSNMNLTSSLENTVLVGRYSLTVSNLVSETTLSQSSLVNSFVLTVDNLLCETLTGNAVLDEYSYIKCQGMLVKTKLSVPVLIPNFSIEVNDINVATRLATSRAKTLPDPISADRFYSTTTMSGTLKNN